jgi:hypothetical protein
MRNLALLVVFAFAVTGIATTTAAPSQYPEIRIAAPIDGLDADTKKKKKKDGGEEDEEEYRPVRRDRIDGNV